MAVVDFLVVSAAVHLFAFRFMAAASCIILSDVVSLGFRLAWRYALLETGQ